MTSLGVNVSGRHHASPGTVRRRVPVVIGAVLVLAGATAIAMRAIAETGDGCAARIPLHIAAAPDIALSVRDVADRWQRSVPRVGEDCVAVSVRAVESADVANLLAVRAGGQLNVAAGPAATPNDADVPAVWIADSVAWLARVQAIARDAFEPAPRSIALSPVVLATPEATARTLTGGRRSVGARDVAGLFEAMARDPAGVQFGVAEPRRDSAGFAGALLVYDAVVTDQGKLVEMVRAYRGIQVAPNAAELLRGFAGSGGRAGAGAPSPSDAASPPGSPQSSRVVPLSEQTVLNHVTGAPGIQLSVVPIEPTVALDYPYAVVTGKPRAVSRAADLFRSALLHSGYADAFSRRGFRAPDGTAGAGFPSVAGVSREPVFAQPLSDAGKNADVLGYWVATKSPSRVLALVDSTASMNAPMTLRSGATVSRMDVLRQAARDGLRLFTDDSELGLWGYAAGSPGQPDHRELVPVGPLTAAQRDRLLTAVNTAAPVPTDVCALYQTVVAAYQAMKAGYREGRSNTIVVFVDGTNSKPGMTLEELQLELERLTDPTRPIRVVLLGIGPDVNRPELAQIALTSGGRSFPVDDPEQIGTIFLQALLRSGGS